MIILKFYDQAIRDKALALPDFDTKLTECKLKLHGATLQGSDHRTIFVNRLPTCPFYFFQPDTLETAIETFRSNLYSKLPELESHHFIRHLDAHGNKERPRSMRLTFKTLLDAQNFLNCNTYILNACISKDTKRFHTHIPARICQTCRKSDHRRGSPNCDGVKRCPRCLSSDHTEVIVGVCKSLFITF